MKNQTIIQVSGLGVPVQAPSSRIQEGFEVRWSSDPYVPADAPVHVLDSEKALRRFIQLAVDQRFVKADLITIVPVQLKEGANSLTREEAIEVGIHPDNWDLVRVAMVISGNNNRGPVTDQIEWSGTREDHRSGAHFREAYERAQTLKIRHPAIFDQKQSGYVQQAADFMHVFNRQMMPSLRAAEQMEKFLEQAILGLDVDTLNGDTALHYLRQFQQSLVDRMTLQQLTVEGAMAPSETPARSVRPEMAEDDEPTASAGSSPKFH